LYWAQWICREQELDQPFQFVEVLAAFWSRFRSRWNCVE